MSGAREAELFWLLPERSEESKNSKSKEDKEDRNIVSDQYLVSSI